MAIAKRRIRRKRPMAPPPSVWGAAGDGFGGANMMQPTVMPYPGMGGGNAMGIGGQPAPPGAAPWKEMGAPGKGFGTPPPGVMMQPGGPMNQFGGFQGGAQQFGPPLGGGLLGNMVGGMGQGMPPGMGQPQQAVMPDIGMAGGMGQVGPTPYDPGVSAGRLAEAQRLAGLGQMGRAKQQWELGGGSWGRDAHRFLRG